MSDLTFAVLRETFSIHRLPPESRIPEKVLAGSFYSVTRTADELSIVCPSEIRFESENEETGWSCLKMLGPLDFSLTGILAGVTAVLKDAGISVFAVSTYDTDYILVKTVRIPEAQEALKNSGYFFK